MNIRDDSPVVRFLIANRLITALHVVDVGASGGIAGYWSQFGRTLSAIGFDPLVNNMKKVAAAEQRPGVSYEAAFIGCKDFDTRFPKELRGAHAQPYQRSSSVRAQELMRMDYVAVTFNEGEPVVWSDRHVTLDEVLTREHEWDFLKVDTDGSDIQVLLGAEGLMKEGAFLGMVVESSFHGELHDYANTLGNMERLLARQGFTLFDFDRHRYSRGALPGLFEYDIPAQTLTGQVVWGDALYFRDLAHPDYRKRFDYDVARERLLKLVALHDIFGLQDCAAELLLAHQALTSDAERTELLDLLVSSAGFPGTYAEHIGRFERDLEAFYPRRYRAPVATPKALPATAAPIPAAAAAPDSPAAVGQASASPSRLSRALKRLIGPS